MRREKTENVTLRGTNYKQTWSLQGMIDYFPKIPLLDDWPVSPHLHTYSTTYSMLTCPSTRCAICEKLDPCWFEEKSSCHLSRNSTGMCERMASWATLKWSWMLGRVHRVRPVNQHPRSIALFIEQSSIRILSCCTDELWDEIREELQLFSNLFKQGFAYWIENRTIREFHIRS